MCVRIFHESSQEQNKARSKKADHFCRRKKHRWLGRTKKEPERSSEIWRGTITKQSAGNPLPFRGESQAPVGLLVYFMF